MGLFLSMFIDILSVDPVMYLRARPRGTPGQWHVDGHSRTCLSLSALASASWDKYAVSVDRCRVRHWQRQHWWWRSIHPPVI